MPAGLDLIFSITGGGGLTWNFNVPIISIESVNGISPNLHRYKDIGTSFKANEVVVTLILFSRSLNDLDDSFSYPYNTSSSTEWIFIKLHRYIIGSS